MGIKGMKISWDLWVCVESREEDLFSRTILKTANCIETPLAGNFRERLHV